MPRTKLYSYRLVRALILSVCFLFLMTSLTLTTTAVAAASTWFGPCGLLASARDRSELGWTLVECYCQVPYCCECFPQRCSRPGPPQVYTPSPQELAQRNANSLNENGLSEYNRGDYADALRSFKRAVEIGGWNDVRGHNIGNANRMLAEEALKDRDFDKARDYFSEAIRHSEWALKQNPGNTLFADTLALEYNGLANLANELGDLGEALRLRILASGKTQSNGQAYRELIGFDYMRLGIAAENRGDVATALRQYELAIKNNPKGKFSGGDSFAALYTNLRTKLATEQRNAETERNLPNKQQNIAKSIGAVTDSISNLNKDRDQKSRDISGLISNLQVSTPPSSTNAAAGTGLFGTKVANPANQDLEPRTSSQPGGSTVASAQAKAAAAAKDAASNCFDGSGGCNAAGSINFPKAGDFPAPRGSAALPQQVREQMLQTDVGKRLIESEQKLRIEQAGAAKATRDAEEKYNNAPPAEKPKLSVEVAKARQEETNSTAKLNVAIVAVEKEATKSYNVNFSEAPVDKAAGNAESPAAVNAPSTPSDSSK